MGYYPSLAMMLLLPWVFFVVALLLFSLRYHHHITEVWFWVTIGAFVSILTMVYDAAGDSGGWHSYL